MGQDHAPKVIEVSNTLLHKSVFERLTLVYYDKIY